MSKVINALNKEIGRSKRPGWVRKSNQKLIGIEQVSLAEVLRYAKKEAYIFGNTLGSIYDEKDTILDLLSNGINVKLLAMDFLDKENYERNCKYLNANVNGMLKSSENAFSRIGQIKNEYSGDKLQIKVTSFPVAIGIVAVDLEENGMIVATHLLPTKEYTKNCLITKICKDSVFYERYKAYIERFWNENIQEVNDEYFDKLDLKSTM